MPIRRLPDNLVSQIAAGEVIERPAAVVKELVENALDAGANDIRIRLEDGGRAAIVVDDDGDGMGRDDLLLALERHATGKLPGGDLVHIETLGFRGEALPSIASVSRFRISSRTRDAAEAWSVTADAGAVAQPKPDSQPIGTRVEVRDLFYPTPARAKFLKQAATERNHAADAVRRLAMAHAHVSFRLDDGDRTVLHLPAAPGDGALQRRERLGRILGRDFAADALDIDAAREGLHLTGAAALPTFHKPSAQSQFLFVNGRPVRDRLLL
ncbi:MAG: DNA mismatch repair endonuclease MutL, partial [Proteobacteria bacterium]|nr:DNA mismatch repair endonuclease MutL [Pseudomonadota bacterium]